MNTKFTKFLAFLLSFAMLISLVPATAITAFAAETTNVAKIGDTEYATLTEAITAAAAGATITLIADVNENVTISKKLTIDGAGKTYTGTMTLKAKNTTFTLNNINFIEGYVSAAKSDNSGSNVNVNNCHFVGTGYYALAIHGINKLTVKNCTAKNFNYGFIYVSSAHSKNVLVEDTTIENVGNYGVAVTSGLAVDLSRVTIKNASRGIYVADTATKSSTLTDCTFENVTNAIAVSGGGKTYDVIFKGVNDLGGGAIPTASNVKINAAAQNGSKFGDLAAIAKDAKSGDTIKLLKDYTGEAITLPEGVKLDANGKAGEDKITVVVPNYVAMIGEQGYKTLAEAFAAANEAAGDYTITLLADNAEEFAFAQNAGVNITIDGEGKTFTGKITLNAGAGNLTITDATLTPSNSDAKTIVLNASTAPNVTIDGCTLKNTGTKGAIVWGQASATSNKVVVKNSTASNLQYLVGTNQGGCEDVTIENVTATNMAYLIRPMKATKATVKDVTYSGLTFVQVKNSNACTLAIENVTVTTTQAGMPPITMLAPDSGSGVKYTITLKGENYANGAEMTVANEDAWFATASAGLPYVIEDLNRQPSGHVAYRADVTDKADREGIAILLKEVYAKNSVVVKVYNNETLMFTCTRRDIDDEGKVMFPVDGNTTANIVLWGKESGSWINEIHVAPTEFNVPNKIEVYADGVLVDSYTHESGTVLGVNLDKYLALDCVEKAVAQIGETKYMTLAEAIAKATAGAEITLLADVNENVTINKNLNIDGAEFNYTGTMTINNVTVTIENVNFVKGQVSKNKNTGTTAKITIKNCDFDGQGMNAYAINLGGTNSIAIENVTAKDYGYGLLQVPSSCAGLTVKNVTVSGCYYGLKVDYANGVTIENANIDATIGIYDSNFGAKTYTIKNSTISSISIWERPAAKTTTFKFEGENEVAALSTSAYAKYEGVQVGNKIYGTLTAAWAAAQDGDTIKLLGNIATSDAIINTKKVTLNLNGKTITGTDNATASFGLITNKSELTITGNGKMTLVATNNRGWNAYSSVISNSVGGKLVVENGTIEHLGGTDMAYGIDNLTNGKGTYAETIINGGTIKSTYRAIRQFLNGVQAQNILTINGGVVEGANKAIFFHDPSKNANSGTLTVAEGATLNGDVYLFVTAGSTEWPVEVAIAASALNGEIITGNVPSKYVVKNNNGVYGVEEKKPYTEAISADKADVTVTGENEVTIKYTGNVAFVENGNGVGSNWISFKITKPADVDADKAIVYTPGSNGTYNAKSLASILDTGKDYASMWTSIQYKKAFDYKIDWNGDGDIDLYVKIDGTEATAEVPVAKVGKTYYTTFADAVAAAKAGQTITVFSTIKITEDTILDLAGITVKASESCQYDIFDVREGATLTINGGTFDSTASPDGYTIYIGNHKATRTGNVVINGGTFVGNCTVAYVACGNLTINGGNFSIAEKDNNDYKYVINCYDPNYENGTATVTINGGTFNKFNPANNAAEGEETNFCATGLTAKESNGVYTVVKDEVAKIGNVKYSTLAEAVAAAKAGQTITLLKNTAGAGVVIDKNLTIDFGGFTYTLTSGVGSGNITSNGFQILEGNKVILKKGTLKVADKAADKFYILVQNYANLEVFNMTLDGTNLDKWSKTDGDSYTLSNNSGKVTLTGTTKIIANNDGDKAFAFDACKYAGYALPTVTVYSTAKIEGEIEAGGRVGNVYYATFEAAYEAVPEGGVLYLVNDLYLTKNDVVKTKEGFNVMFNFDKDVTFNLDGNTIYVDYDSTELLYAVIFAEDDVKLNVMDSKEGGIEVKTGDTLAGKYDCVAYMFWKRGTTGNLYISGGNYHANKLEDSMVYTNANSKVTVAGGTFILDNVGSGTNGAPWIFNTQGQNERKIIVKGGTFNADVFHQHWFFEVDASKELALKYDEATGLYTVVDAVAYVNEQHFSSRWYTKNVGYATLQEAIEAVEPVREVKIGKNVYTSAEEVVTLLSDIIM